MRWSLQKIWQIFWPNNCFCLVKNADFLNEFFFKNYFCLYLQYIFYLHFLDSAISLIYVRAKTELHYVEGCVRTESKEVRRWGGGEGRSLWKMKGEKMKANPEYYLLLCVFFSFVEWIVLRKNSDVRTQTSCYVSFILKEYPPLSFFEMLLIMYWKPHPIKTEGYI